MAIADSHPLVQLAGASAPADAPCALHSTPELWRGVDVLLERASSPEGLVRHRLDLLDARRRRARGLAIPDPLLSAERISAVTGLAVGVLLARARAAYAGRLVLMKGADVAARYPDPLTRPFRDIDLLADDAAAAQAALRVAGFQEVGEPSKYRDIHHLRPLAWPGLPVTIEVHSRPKWLQSLPAAPVDALLAAAALAEDGIGRLPAEHHAVLLAVHAWAHAPLGRLGHVLDVAAMTAAGDRRRALDLATEWGCVHPFDVTLRAADALFSGGPPAVALRVWARHLASAREQTVFEGHVTSLLAPAWEVPRRSAPAALVRGAIADLVPGEGETWRCKAARARRALRSARAPKSVYDRQLSAEIEREGLAARAAQTYPIDGAHRSSPPRPVHRLASRRER